MSAITNPMDIKDQNDENIIPAVRRRMQQNSATSQVSSMSTPQSTTITKVSQSNTPQGQNYQAAVQRRMKKKSGISNDDSYVVQPQQQ